MFQLQTQTARDASGADIRGGLKQGPLRVIHDFLAIDQPRLIYP